MIVGTFNKIPSKQNSHSYGWARTWSENLSIPLDHSNSYHDTVHLLHGANFTGGLNLFGGFTEQLKASIDNFLLAKEVFSLDMDCPDYGKMLATRKDVEDKEWCQHVSDKCAEAKTIISSDLPFTHLAIGDSHTAAYAPHNSSVIKQDGTTLFGQIKTDFEYIRSHIKPHHKSITISLGNIDVRHHICRVDANVSKMIDAYVDFINELEDGGLEVEVGLPWPIEYEGRKLPKTGYYKAQPFWGSREHRMEAVESIISLLVFAGVNTVQCPPEWYEMNPEKYAIERMEGRQSVHLNPMFYRRMDWGVVDNNLENFFG